MHELSIAQAVVEQVTTHLASRPGAKAATVRLTVGVLSGVDPSALISAFPIAAHGSPLEAAELAIEIREPGFRCRDCGEKPDNTSYTRCPFCASPNLELETGAELEIDSVEIVEP
jgi:hydrogenase nickel incorporation protein HypA/HybF